MSFSKLFFKQGIIILFFAVLIFSAACSSGSGSGNSANKKEGNSSNQTSKSENSIQITTTKAVARDVPAYVQSTGSLISDETSDVAPQTSGQIISTPVDVGAFVKQGDILARLNDKDARLRLQQSQDSVKQAEAGVRQAEARLGLTQNGSFQASVIPEVRAADANYQQLLSELKLAEVNEKRYRELVETGDVAMILYDQYRTTRDTAKAKVNSAKQQLEAAINSAKQNNQAIKTAQTAVESAKTQVEVAQKAVNDTIVRSPYSGFVSSRPTAIGESVTTSSVIATIVRSNPIKAQLKIDEGEVPNVSIGAGVSLAVAAYKDRKFAGTITAINPSLDAASRTATIEATIENSGNLLRSGMFAAGQIVRSGGKNGVFVPRAAVYSDQNTQSYRAFVIEENIAKLRVVQIGPVENDMIQILSGVNADETVAVSNIEQLYEGAKVSQ
jgi:multidrug efflux pump subunit AcrA (membrane-fusion protein)